MLNFLIYIIFFNLILISIVGYGFLANRLFFKTENYSLLGFIGLSFLTFLGLTTSLFTNHNYLHNTFIFKKNLTLILLSDGAPARIRTADLLITNQQS